MSNSSDFPFGFRTVKAGGRLLTAMQPLSRLIKDCMRGLERRRDQGFLVSKNGKSPVSDIKPGEVAEHEDAP